MKKRYGAFILAAVMCVIPAAAEDGDIAIGFEGVRFLYSLIPSGVDLSLTYTGLDLMEQADTKLFLKAGGGYEDTVLARDPNTGNPSLLSKDGGSGIAFNTPNFQWELAFIQGFSRRDDGNNMLEAFAFYRGRYDIYPNSAYSSDVFTDMQGLFGTSLMGGLSYDSVATSRHRAKSGVYAEASAEWGPDLLNAKTDFWRVSSKAKGFLPVFDIPTEGGNLFNIYLAGFASVDYAQGSSVPIYVNQSFGGRDLRSSMGDCVRGYGWNAYDASLKTVANAEIRLVGPAIWLDAIVPYLFGFADAGYYAGFADTNDFADASGFLSSLGAGIALDLVGFAQVGITVGHKLIADTLYGPADGFFWGLKFFLHF
ncbi:hypothetical protein MASR2M48_08670 [Spirochaetota bacterium]